MNRPKDQQELTENIYKMAQEELKDLEATQKEYNDKMPDDGIESLDTYREPLSLDITKEVNIMLSWGGPSDGYKLQFDKDNELMGGVYWYADWGTYAESKLDDEQAELVYSIYMMGDAQSFFDSQL